MSTFAARATKQDQLPITSVCDKFSLQRKTIRKADTASDYDDDMKFLEDSVARLVAKVREQGRIIQEQKEVIKIQNDRLAMESSLKAARC
jgi:hypothetical protein